ncbi:MAG: FtsQ-type POTRA domain-containing protein [Aphanocapsa lilacina HA4352-LM1]|nr:FtsQ-type POTRA domain-containing protein [Aphanocapsa lilacina HA4352-LM1]
MTTVLSKAVLVARRQEFRRRRWLWRLLGLWRVLLAAGLAAGLVWLAREPFWQIRSAEAVRIAGHERLQLDQIQRVLKLDYPQPILSVRPEQLQQRLLGALPLQTVRIERQLLPPSLSIEVQEREPVAFAPLPNRPGLIDRSGVWIDSRQYRDFRPPQLTVWGYSAEKAPLWKELYPQVARSPLAIRVIDLRNLADVILRTELGEVHLGAFGPQFSTQLRRLDQMREALKRYPPGEVTFIDLRSSQLPVLRLRNPIP